MSNAILLVRFPDGTIRYGTYHGAADIPFGPLYDDPEDYYKAREMDPKRRYEDDADRDKLVDVDIYSDYGGGFSWRGTAVPWTLVDRGNVFSGTDGVPEWAQIVLKRIRA